MSDLVLLKIQDKILHMQLNRPEKMNAITQEMYTKLMEGFEQARTDPEIRVVLLSATGDHYSGGNDIEDFTHIIKNDADRQRGRTFLHTIAHFEKPIVAGVQGVVAGIGATMLLHFDLVYASEDAQLLMPFVQIAAVAEGGSSLLLPLHVGYRAANELLLLSEPMSAQKAFQFGYYNDVVSRDKLVETARKKALRLAELPEKGILQTKKLIRNTWRDRISPVIDHEIALFIKQLRTPESQQILNAFLEKQNKPG